MRRQLDIRQTLYVPVFNCARCGQDHAEIKYKQFKRPFVDSDGTIYQWWAICPVNNDPILMHAEQVRDGYLPEVER